MPRERSIPRWIGHGVAVAVLVLPVLVALSPPGQAVPRGQQTSAAAAAANGMIAVFAWPPGAHVSDPLDLVVMTADGADAQVLVPEAAQRSLCGFDLDWSPDGNRLAWASGGELWVVDADGTNQEKVADGCISHLAWSPDGGSLAVEIDSRTAVIGADGTGFRWLRDCGWGEGWASWSPDGSTIATVATGDCTDSDPLGWGVYGFAAADGHYVARYADTNLRGQVGGLDAIPDGAEWHPDGDRLLMWMDDGGDDGTCHPLGQPGYYSNADLYTVAPQTDSPLVKVGSTSGEYDWSERDASWSPDGQRILHTAYRNTSCQDSSYVMSGVELATVAANGAGRETVWTPTNPTLGFVHSDWQPCTAQTVTCVPPGGSVGDTDGDGVLDDVDACPAQPGPVENDGCPLDPEPVECDGLVAADVVGSPPSYLTSGVLSSFPNDDTMCSGLWLAGSDDGFIPQGLSLVGGSAWVSGYTPGTKECRVMRVHRDTGAVLQQVDGITGRDDAGTKRSCHHAGGTALTKHGLWVVDTQRLWLLDPDRIGNSPAVIDQWKLHKDEKGGGRDPRALKGSFLLEGNPGRLGIGQFERGRADRIRLFSFKDLLRDRTTALIGKGDPKRNEAAPNGSAEAVRGAQGAAFGTDATPGLYAAASSSTCGNLFRNAIQGFGFGPGVEEIQFDDDGYLWAVFEASAKKYHANSDLVVPMLARFDAARLLGDAAEGPRDCFD